jgi:uncharacterized protein (TIGR01777 family)
MKIVIAGATGLIGSELANRFSADDHTIVVLARDTQQVKPQYQSSEWNPSESQIDSSVLEGADLVINLAGANLAQRWTNTRKREILESRLQSTHLLSKTIAQLDKPPELFISASAIGYYGNHDPEEKVDEATETGAGFLASVCQKWEAATRPAEEKGVRVVHPRFGIVLSKSGGALARMLPIFRKGAGGKLGSGKQMMSWIDLAEIYPAIQHIISHRKISGPVNLVSPEPVSNVQFTRVLADILNKPSFFTASAFMLKLAYGQMADEALLSGAAVYPTKLLESGYDFKNPDLAGALREILC